MLFSSLGSGPRHDIAAFGRADCLRSISRPACISNSTQPTGSVRTLSLYEPITEHLARFLVHPAKRYGLPPCGFPHVLTLKLPSGFFHVLSLSAVDEEYRCFLLYLSVLFQSVLVVASLFVGRQCGRRVTSSPPVD